MQQNYPQQNDKNQSSDFIQVQQSSLTRDEPEKQNNNEENFLTIKNAISLNQKEQNYSMCLKFLEANEWKQDCLLHWQQWEELDSNEKDSIQLLCNNELLFKEAQTWLKQESTRQKKKNLSLSNNDTGDDSISLYSQRMNNTQQTANKQNYLFDQPLPTLSIENQQNDQDNLKVKSVQNWNNIIQKCENCSYSERSHLLSQHYFNDPIIFVECLRENSKKQYFQNIFSNLLSIVMQLKKGHEKTSLFLASCSFYNNEILGQNLKETILNEILQQALQKLIMEQLHHEILGFLKLIFVNTFLLTEDHQNQISKLLQQSPIAFTQFKNQIQKVPFNFREEVIERLPNTGHIFSQPFLNILKETKGDIFLKFPNKYRQLFIEITVYSCEQHLATIQNFNILMSDYFQEYGIFFEKAHIYDFLIELIVRLKKKNLLWVNNLLAIQQILEKIRKGIIDQKIITTKIINSCLDGDNSCLENEISKSKIIENGSIQQMTQALIEFKQLNQQKEMIQTFVMRDFNQISQKLFREIEEKFGRQFHSFQVLCLKFILSQIRVQRFFIQFGLGNGKTLLSTTIAIMICSLLKRSVVILVKSQYLLYRDYKKFKNLIESCGLMSAYQSFLHKGISYLDEKQFSKLIKTLSKNDQYIIGFTGSTLSQEECECLKIAFNGEIIKFPKMQDSNEHQILQKRSFIYNSQDQWLYNLFSVAQETSLKVPVIIALEQFDITKVVKYFKSQGLDAFDLSDYVKKNKFAELQTLIEQQFSQKIKESNYGVYIINSELGRGTDFPSSNIIEQNGGIYLILGDIFSPRTSEQIRGRVSRMQNKGQFQYIVNMKQEGNTFDYIQNRTNVLRLIAQSNNEGLLTLLRKNNILTNQNLQIEKEDNIIYTFFDSSINNDVCVDCSFDNTQKQMEDLSVINNYLELSEEDEKQLLFNDDLCLKKSKTKKRKKKQDPFNVLPLKRSSEQDTQNLQYEIQKESQIQNDLIDHGKDN